MGVAELGHLVPVAHGHQQIDGREARAAGVVAVTAARVPEVPTLFAIELAVHLVPAVDEVLRVPFPVLADVGDVRRSGFIVVDAEFLARDGDPGDGGCVVEIPAQPALRTTEPQLEVIATQVPNQSVPPGPVVEFDQDAGDVPVALLEREDDLSRHRVEWEPAGVRVQKLDFHCWPPFHDGRWV